MASTQTPKVRKVPANKADRGFGHKTCRAKKFDLKKVEQLAAQGLPDYKIAIRLGCDPSTVQNHKDKDPDFLAAIERGRARAEDEISDVLYQTARDRRHRSHVDAAKFILSRRHDWTETVKNQHEGGGPGSAAINITISKDDEAL